MKGFLKTKPPLTQFIILICFAIVSLFLFGLVGGVIVSAISGVDISQLGELAKLDLSKDSTVTAIRGLQVVNFISLYLVPAFLCAKFYSTDSKTYLGFKKPYHPAYFIVGIVLMIGAMPFAGLLGELNRQIPFPADMAAWMKEKEVAASAVMNGVLAKHTIKDLILNLICIAAVAGIGEELLFRGVVQRLLIKMFRSPLAGILVASILFSAMHFQFYGFIPRVLFGVLLGFLYWYSGSLWVSMLAHFVYDGFLIVLAYVNPEMMKEESVKLSNVALTAAISGVLLVLLFIWMRKRSSTTYQQVYADDAIPVKDHPF